MDGNNTVQIIILVVLVILSGYFSATETAFSSLNRIRLKNLASNGSKRAQATLDLVENYDKLLSTILIGNNIVNIASASIATVVFVHFFGNAGVSLSTVVMTVVVLIFGEISPKGLAKEAPEKFAMFSAPVIRVIMTLFTPLNFLFMQWKKLLTKMIKVKDAQGITEDELLTIVDEAQNEGGIDEHEGELIRSAIEFNDLDVKDILTPRVDVIAIDVDSSMEEIGQNFRENNYSRLPVYRESIDDIIGVLHEKDYYTALERGEQSVQNYISPVIYATRGMKISRLLRMLQNGKVHIAIVADEYGGTLGIVTLEDILEELVGEIWDEHDEVIEEFVKLEEHVYQIACSASLDDLFELFCIKNECNSNTVSGWVVEELGKIPEEGDHFIYENLDVTVTKVDSRRVLEIQVKVLEEENTDGQAET